MGGGTTRVCRAVQLGSRHQRRLWLTTCFGSRVMITCILLHNLDGALMGNGIIKEKSGEIQMHPMGLGYTGCDGQIRCTKISNVVLR